MSYCRFGWDGSSVYVYASGGPNRIVCHACNLYDGEIGDFEADSAEEMLVHLRAHKAAGHNVPPYAIQRLEDECFKAKHTRGKND